MFFLCIISCLYATDFPEFNKNSKDPDLAKQWADYITNTKKASGTDTHRRNRLNDDPEQQMEHDQKCYTDLITQLHTIQQKTNHKTSEKKLVQLELACRVITQALLHFYENGKEKALEHAEEIALSIVARIKLLQDPFWRQITQEIETKKTAPESSIPSYSIHALEKNLPMQKSKKDRLIKLLLKQLEKKQCCEQITTEALEDLSRTLASYKKKPDELLSLLAKLEHPAAQTRIKNSKKAIALFNGAVISEIQADIKFLHSHDKHEYPEFEKAYGAVALLYLQAHDYGHPSGLIEAEKIMLGGVMQTIINWKSRHRYKTALDQYSMIWKEINKRKYSQLTDIDQKASSSEPST